MFKVNTTMLNTNKKCNSWAQYDAIVVNNNSSVLWISFIYIQYSNAFKFRDLLSICIPSSVSLSLALLYLWLASGEFRWVYWSTSSSVFFAFLYTIYFMFLYLWITVVRYYCSTDGPRCGTNNYYKQQQTTTKTN